MKIQKKNKKINNADRDSASANITDYTIEWI